MALVLLVATGATLNGQTNAGAEGALTSYSRTTGVFGKLNSVGSDTLNGLMNAWAEAFRQRYPNAVIQIEGKGSATAPPSLIQGTAQIGPMSRTMRRDEVDAFRRSFGYPPTRIAVALDALAVFVHRSNPLPGLTLAQLDGLYSVTRYKEGPAIRDWRDLGLRTTWDGRRIVLFGRNSASGTHATFKRSVLLDGDFRPEVKELLGSTAVVLGVSEELAAIGYAGVGSRFPGVRIVPLQGADGRFYTPSREHCVDGSYPLARSLFVYVNRPPGAPLDRLTYEFLQFILSAEGQALVPDLGYYALPSGEAREMLRLLGPAPEQTSP
ncbi:MAG: PstS family phosphate ABC transporter substrate-binding protein [Opitutales bacterium]